MIDPKGPLRVAFVSPEFVTESYHSGGLANYLGRVSVQLAATGHDVHVLIHSADREDPFEYQGVKVYPHRRGGRVQRVFRKVLRGRLANTALWLDFSAQAYRTLRKLHAQKPFDVLQFASSRACGLVSACFFRRVPSVTRISSYRPFWNRIAGVPRSFDERLLERMEGLQLKCSRGVFAPSAFLAAIVKEKEGLRAIDTVRTPFFCETPELDETEYRKLSSSRYALFFGRLQMHKGPQVLALALPRILDEMPSFNMVFVGLDGVSPEGGSMRDFVLGKVREDQRHRIIFVDQLRHAQLYPILQGAQLVILPSLIENIPNALLEAMSFGRTVVATDGVSFDEIIQDGVNGFLFPKGDSSALADKVLEIWDDPKRRNRIGAAAASTIADFAPESTVPELLAYYAARIDAMGHRSAKS